MRGDGLLIYVTHPENHNYKYNYIRINSKRLAEAETAKKAGATVIENIVNRVLARTSNAATGKHQTRRRYRDADGHYDLDLIKYK